MTVTDRIWWKDGVVYQIYPASYKDSNGDGLGDIPGIISKIDYIKDLGIDIVWLSPMYKSPQLDMGYDISDYEAVHAPYGTMEDMDTLIDACHSRGMRLILDLVVNHTSDQHAWFQESRSSKNNPKRDWYIWRPARYTDDGKRIPPCNWRSYFSGPTWEWDEHTQEYYLHLFAKEQPDLNWENPETRKAIYKSAMEFWLSKGVDGFRIDTVNMYSKGTEFRDAPIVDPGSFEQPAEDFFCNGPRMHEFLREMNALVLDKYDAMTVGELPHTPDPAHVRRYVDALDKQLNMVFQFDVVDLGTGTTHKYDFQEYTLKEFKSIITKWQTFITGTDAWTTAFCENHDQGRSVSRYASDAPQWRIRSAKLLCMMLCAMTGTLFIYQGQEIGMINAPKNWPIEEYKDIEGLNYYREVEKRTGGDPAALKHVLESLQIIGRDHARLPMQWDSSPHAGFTTNKNGGWMRVNDSYKEINVADQLTNRESVLNFWKKMLRKRKEYKDVLIHGDFECFDLDDPKLFIFSKTFGQDVALVVLNFTDQDVEFQFPRKLNGSRFDLLIGNVEGDGSKKVLGGYEGRIYMVS